MNVYLDQICAAANMEKSAEASERKTEAMQTATIGAVGIGTGYLATKIGKAFPHVGNHTGKMAALIGGIGLAGDYAAVKINKKLEKKAMDNKYLEKIAESYQVNGHPGLGRGMFDTPKINLDRSEYHQYARGVEDRTSWVPPVLGAAFGAGAGRGLSTLVSKHPGVPKQVRLAATLGRSAHTWLGAAIGANLGNRAGHNHAHAKTLEDLKMVNPYHPILDHDED